MRPKADREHGLLSRRSHLEGHIRPQIVGRAAAAGTASTIVAVAGERTIVALTGSPR